MYAPQVYQQRTRFQPWTYDELARVPMAEANRDVIGHALSTKLGDLETNAQTLEDREILEGRIGEINTGLDEISQSIIGGKVDSQIVQDLMKKGKSYRDTSSLLTKYQEEMNRRKESFEQNAAKEGWDADRIEKEKQKYFGENILDEESNITSKDFFMHDRVPIEEMFKKTAQLLGTRGTGTGYSGSTGYGNSRLFTRKDINNKNLPQGARDVLSAGAAYVMVDSQGKTKKVSNRDGLAILSEYMIQNIENNPSAKASLEYEYGDDWKENVIRQVLQLEGIALKEDEIKEHAYKISNMGDIGYSSGPGGGIYNPPINSQNKSGVNHEENIKRINEQEEKAFDSLPNIEYKKILESQLDNLEGMTPEIKKRLFQGESISRAVLKAAGLDILDVKKALIPIKDGFKPTNEQRRVGVDIQGNPNMIYIPEAKNGRLFSPNNSFVEEATQALEEYGWQYSKEDVYKLAVQKQFDMIRFMNSTLTKMYTPHGDKDFQNNIWQAEEFFNDKENTVDKQKDFPKVSSLTYIDFENERLIIKNSNTGEEAYAPISKLSDRGKDTLKEASRIFNFVTDVNSDRSLEIEGGAFSSHTNSDLNSFFAYVMGNPEMANAPLRLNKIDKKGSRFTFSFEYRTLEGNSVEQDYTTDDLDIVGTFLQNLAAFSTIDYTEQTRVTRK